MYVTLYMDLCSSVHVFSPTTVVIHMTWPGGVCSQPGNASSRPAAVFFHGQPEINWIYCVFPSEGQ